MCNINFLQGPSYYGYGPGVNAANLTSKDIAKANARIKPQRQRRIQHGSLKVTRGDTLDKSSTNSAVGDGCLSTVPKYSSWTRKELRKAILGRRIKSENAVARMTRPQLIDILSKADQKSSLSRFLELPPELRNEIYKHAIMDIITEKTDLRVRPASPAICRINKQTRSESLPLFFHSIDQNIIVSLVAVGPHRIQRAMICDEYYDYFAKARKLGWLQHMRRFHFRLSEHAPGRNGQTKKDKKARYHVKFASNMQNVKTSPHEKSVRDGLLPKLEAGIATTTEGGKTTMTGKKFNSMITVFLQTVNLYLAE